MIPLVHDFSGETVLVFGGGHVGARKARRFAREARVVVVSPTFVNESFGGAERVRAAPDAEAIPNWLDRIEPALVVAATDETTVNEAIEAAAMDRRILVNRADIRGSRAAGSVVVPATVRDGPVLVAISTEGTEPALSRGLRVRLEEQLTGSERVAEALKTVGESLRQRELEADSKRGVLQAVASSSTVWEAARDTGADIEAVARQVADEALDRSPP